MAIWKKLSLLLFFSGLLPLMVFGQIAMSKAVKSQYETISKGNALVAARSADQIGQYISMVVRVLRALSENINKPGMNRDLQEGIIRNYIINFKPFQEISLVDLRGREIMTQGIVTGENGPLRDKAVRKALDGEEAESEVFITQDMTPAMFIAVPLRRLAGISGALVAQVNLVEMWNLVDSLKIGGRGWALVASASGLLIAHGEGRGKAEVLKGKNVGGMEVVKEALSGRTASRVYVEENGQEVLGVGSPVPGTGWAVVIEQPTMEAYLPARAIGYQLAGLAFVFLLVSLSIGYLVSREIVSPIRSLMAGAASIASGDLTARVEVETRDEMGDLGRTFNDMAERLVLLQEDVKQKERTAVFGRMSQGIVHDLKNPLVGMQMALKSLEGSEQDPKDFAMFRKNMAEAVSYINTLVDNLRNLYKPLPLEPVPLNIDRELTGILDGFIPEAREKGVRVQMVNLADGATARADLFALKRVVGNIVRNAIEAMPGGGDLTIYVRRDDGRVKASFTDTGPGIPRDKLSTCFTDCMTTKRKGLGLGLAISKKLIEEMGGSISVESDVGHGATFTISLPPAEDQGRAG